MRAPRLDGDGFFLSGIEPEDAEAWLAGEDGAALRGFEAPGPASLDDVRRAIAGWMTSWSEGGSVRQWAIRDGPDARLAGGVDLRDLGAWQRANLAYVVFPEHRGQRLATRAARILLPYAVGLGVRTLRIATLPWNAPSKRVAEALGARPVGSEPSDAGDTFDVYELALDASAVGDEQGGADRDDG